MMDVEAPKSSRPNVALPFCDRKFLFVPQMADKMGRKLMNNPRIMALPGSRTPDTKTNESPAGACGHGRLHGFGLGGLGDP